MEIEISLEIRELFISIEIRKFSLQFLNLILCHCNNWNSKTVFESIEIIIELHLKYEYVH